MIDQNRIVKNPPPVKERIMKKGIKIRNWTLVWKLTTKNIEILESFKEENDFSDVGNKTEIDLNEYNYFKN